MILANALVALTAVFSLFISTRVLALDDAAFDRPSRESSDAARAQIEMEFPDLIEPSDRSIEGGESTSLTNGIDPGGQVPRDLLAPALKFLDTHRASFPNQNYLTVIDFAPHSSRVRFHVVNLKTGAVNSLHTTHGLGSDFDDSGYAKDFGNIVSSAKTSIGYFRTAEVYSGHYGRSLRIDGLTSSNSRVRERAIVVHGWNYAFEKNVKQGLTAGCFALDWKVKDKVLDLIKGGSLIFAGVSGRKTSETPFATASGSKM